MGKSNGHTATGGVVSDYTTTPGDVYRAHVFTASGTFNVSAIGNIDSVVEYLVVAGGGGGGNAGGGGGAGGFMKVDLVVVPEDLELYSSSSINFSWFIYNHRWWWRGRSRINCGPLMEMVVVILYFTITNTRQVGGRRWWWTGAKDSGGGLNGGSGGGGQDNQSPNTWIPR